MMKVISTNSHIVKLLIFAFLFLSSVLMIKNDLQYNIARSHSDEIHTMNFGINSLYSGEVTVLRVGETSRWLARAIYPVALYYMNVNMGGEHFVTGWNYPSGYYIKKHFKKPKDIRNDPNLQDFVFAMKFVLGSLVLLSFLGASYMLSKYYGFLAGCLYFVLATSSTLVTDMLTMFYTESSLIILFNLLVVLALTKNCNKWRLYIWSSVILALAISTKLTGVVFVLPIIALIMFKDNILRGMKLEGFILLTIVFLAIINIYASDYMELLDQTLANVYHLKTGHKFTEPSGLYQVKNITTTLFPWVIIFPFAIGYIIYKKPAKYYFLYCVAVSAIIMLVALVGVSFFLERNLTTPQTLIIFIISLASATVIRGITYKPQIVMTSTISLLLIYQVVTVVDNYRSVTHDRLKGYLKNSKNIATIDVESGIVDNSTVLEGMPDSFTLVNQLEDFKNKFTPYDCVVIKRVNNNKHLTNYILPLDYKLTARHGNYFIYINPDR